MSGKKKVLMLASVASMIDQFNMPNIRLLMELGYEVHVACNFREGNTCDGRRIQKLKSTLDDMHAAWHQWDCPRSIYSIKKCRRAYRQLLDLTGSVHFEFLHCHSPAGGALARLAAHKRNLRVIYTAHGFHFYRGAPFKNWLLYYPAEKLLSRWTDVLVTVNEEDYQTAKKKLKAEKIFHIPGVGIDTDRFASVQQPRQEEKKKFRRQYGIAEDAAVLLSVGELNKGKNHRMAVAAAAALARQDVYYVICGQGALYGRLKKYARRRNVSGRIRMPGYQEDMPWIYRNADIFVFPSKREGMPAALMEAMAAGLPCVVSDIRGNRELIDDASGNHAGAAQAQPESGGMRFPLKKPQLLLEALRRLLDDEQLRKKCGLHNQEKIKNYSREAVDRQMRGIYKSMASRSAEGSETVSRAD